ncbi:uncharacterized protein LOC143265305 [Megachile rotundata]|uniref:uncharacterized protein LOC143265305 n=1 Tax=Megachile rotundata TaxID=143995 RepID=UPI003FD1F623
MVVGGGGGDDAKGFVGGCQRVARRRRDGKLSCIDPRLQGWKTRQVLSPLRVSPPSSSQAALYPTKLKGSRFSPSRTGTLQPPSEIANAIRPRHCFRIRGSLRPESTGSFQCFCMLN